MYRTFYNLFIAAVIAMALSACNGDQQAQTGSGDTRAIDTAQFAPPLAPGQTADTAAPGDTTSTGPVATHTAVISTTAGDIEVELYGKDAPKTVRNFVGLARKGFYEGLAFHRVSPGYVIQAGDPLTKDPNRREEWGSGGESIYGGNFEDELDPNSPSGRRGYVTGTLAMANRGPNTNSSQFFIVISTQGAGHLNYAYTIFGMVRKGMDGVGKIEATGFQGESPLNPEKITKVTVTDLPAAAEMAK